MVSYKKLLADRLTEAVRKYFHEAKCIKFMESGEGFYCDYDIPPLVPKVFEEIGKQVYADDLNCAFELRSYSGVYEDDNANNRVLQRIYVIAFPTADELMEYKNFLEEAAKRDHKILGNELRLFSASNDIGQGLILW
ncbi:MAG TPA: hypothetical protein PK304_04440, partial [Mobilitalea sp.]|nr:hypothetical protein [Mobilitalea sp.]